MAIYAAFFLEWLRIKHRMNPFALRSKLYLKAIRQAFEEIAAAKGRVTSLSKEDDADFLIVVYFEKSG